MTEPTSDRGAAGRWPTGRLVASLGLNLAVVGLVAGLALKGPPPPRRAARSGSGATARALPEPYRDDLSGTLRDSRARLGWTARAPARPARGPRRGADGRALRSGRRSRTSSRSSESMLDALARPRRASCC